MTEHMSISARIKESAGDGPFRFFGPDDSTPFELPGRASLGGLDQAVWLEANFALAVRRILGKDAAKLKSLNPSVQWLDALRDAYSEHLGASGKSAGSSR